ncbi:MAG: hemolysin family protein [Gammaproteobacteria bacterium]|nr:hemolysin family protein [Gammaproteobacteria bacterium]
MTLLFLYLAIAIGVSFVCSVLEAVLLSITPSFVENIANNQPKASKVLIKVKSRLDESISSILILNTFAHTMGAAGVGAQATKVFGVRWETLIAVLLTLAILYFSEIIPKTIGATFWRQLAIPSANIIYWLVKLVYPLVWFSTLITKMFSNNKSDEISREEIIALASLGHKMGSLVTQENDYLSNVLRLRDIKTGQILTPRSVMHSLDESVTVSEALEDDKTRQYSRMPVYKNNHEDISGFVTNRALFVAEREGNGKAVVSAYARPVTRVSENLPVQQLLDLFIKKREHQFLVEDEFGQVAGIVTLEDAIETVLGREIVDETDTVEDMQGLARDNFRSRLRENKQAGDR